MAIDPVCKMEVEQNQAEAKADYAGQTYYFCSEACHTFTAEPQKYAGAAPHGGTGGTHHHGHG
ncbi:MAG: YHS domain-containing protein [Gammaproteobacteria bacterium]|nr:YHS domain-containing protein [Gammaproteobacteria bacterium]